MRRLAAIAAALLVTLTLGAGAAAAAEAILNFDSTVSLAKDGELTVTERIRVRAEGSQIKRGIFRDFPLTFMDAQQKLHEVPFSLIDVTRDGDVIKLNLPDAVTFDFNSASLKSQFRPALDGVAATLAEYPQTVVEISGHTDAVGSDAYNQRLSEERAGSVSSYLVGKGLVRERFEVVGMGERYPIASNDTAAGKQANRRIGFTLRTETH